MKMEVQITSKDTIKPSSPTPPHLRNYKLSLLDHLIPAPYAPIVLFYPCNTDYVISLDLLRQSLSKTLTRFYPLAGTMKDDLSIDCNDEGAYYVETRVNCTLDHFLTKPDLVLIHKFFPCDLILKESAGTFASNFQVNVFECGGIAIGICISHKVVDGAALSTFIKAWSGAARGCGEAILPDFVASSLFPTSDLWLRDSSIAMWGSLFRLGKCRTQRFVFDSSAITGLKAKANLKLCPTRVEAVSGFLWKCLMNASEKKHGSPRPSFLTHLVNLRRRISHPTLENSMGNLLWIAATRCVVEHKPGLKHFVTEVKEATSKIDGEFVKTLRSDEGSSVMSDSFKEIGELGRQGVECFGFSSWCKFGFYDADFGWGKPVWVSSFGMDGSVFINLIMLNDTRFGDGIEAWVTLDEEEMNILEHNPELVEFASLDPSPLHIGESKPCC
ncbi:stemmadenine O-acetyltransferase-like [Tripterygium wilfordii]|uniref:stemmadenine O-acetyltransferase-like n=1 Tax=Tripterygium wilfordii TaxID=458696 RepID=UPI0018F83F7E|nr:stemmadenine O-acetyltransferase-like [Tripterygium wilfordii]